MIDELQKNDFDIQVEVVDCFKGILDYGRSIHIDILIELDIL